MNAAAASRCRVNPGGMARPSTSRQRPVRGRERQDSAGQNRDGQSDVAYAKSGFAALDVSLHDILLQSLDAQVWRRKKARLGPLARQSAPNSRVRDWLRKPRKAKPEF
jgi:hypothetical protein